jgi:hypothetical protein
MVSVPLDLWDSVHYTGLQYTILYTVDVFTHITLNVSFLDKYTVNKYHTRPKTQVSQ